MTTARPPGGRPENERHPLVRALNHSRRVAILRLLAKRGGKMNPKEIAQSLHQELDITSYHVRFLAECGAVELVDSDSVRGFPRYFYVFSISEPWALAALDLTEFPEAEGSPADKPDSS